MCEEKLVLAQEELVANRNQLSAHESQIQELKTARTVLEKDLSKRDEKIKQQVEALQKLQKQQVTQFDANFWDITVVHAFEPQISLWCEGYGNKCHGAQLCGDK